MHGLSISQLLIILLVFLLLFGGRKISSLMIDLAQGIKSFKKAMEDNSEILKDDTDNDTDKKNKT